MTSGHGEHGPDRPQGGPPPWQPPGPPPWPPGGPPPYGQGPYGPPGPFGYGPMPSAGGPRRPPERTERPLTVRAGLGAFIAAIVLGLAGSLFAWANWDEYVAQMLAQQSQFQDPEFEQTGIDPEALVGSLATAVLVVQLVFVVLYLLFVWFAWRGYNWARIVLWVLGGLGIVSGLIGLAGASAGTSPFPSQTALGVFQFLAVLVGVVLLARQPSNAWFRAEKEWRAATGPR